MSSPVQRFDQAWAGNPFWSRMGDKQFRLQKRMTFTYHVDIIEEITLIRTKDPEISGSNPENEVLENQAELVSATSYCEFIHPNVRVHPIPFGSKKMNSMIWKSLTVYVSSGGL